MICFNVMPGYEAHLEEISALLHEAEHQYREFKVHMNLGLAPQPGEAEPGTARYPKPGTPWHKRWKAYASTDEYRRLQMLWIKSTEGMEALAESIRDGLRTGRLESVDRALAFLAVRVRTFRSGYWTQRIARVLKRSPLTEGQRDILRHILLDKITWEGKVTWDVWRCYPLVRTPEMDQALLALTKHPQGWVTQRAQRISGKYGPAT